MPEPADVFTVLSVTWLSVDAAIAVITLCEDLPPVPACRYIEAPPRYTALVGPDGCHFLKWHPDRIPGGAVYAAMIHEHNVAKTALQ